MKTKITKNKELETHKNIYDHIWYKPTKIFMIIFGINIPAGSAK